MVSGIVFQKEKEGSCLPSAWNTVLYFTGKRSGKIVQGVQIQYLLPQETSSWDPYTVLVTELFVCWLDNKASHILGSAFPEISLSQ